METRYYSAETLRQIWDKCISKLKDEIPEIQFDSYIVPLKLLDISADTAHIEIPYEFYAGILESKYYESIAGVLAAETGKALKISFHLPDQYQKADSEADKFCSAYDSHLNKKYTFDSFIIGNSNRMAYAAAVAITTSPGKAYNPLFIYGQSGLGKTHLLHAIGNQILREDPSKKVLYVPSETFTNEFVDAITHKKNDEFRNKYRKIDVLLIDDIQFISRMERTQEEFFYTFNALYEDQKQIVISCDSPLNKIEVLEERLRTRFAWGLIADIQAPDYETKIAILNKKASENSLEVENQILDYIAYYTGDNIRELEGVINHLSISLQQGREINLNLAKEALRHLQNNDVHEVTAGVIIDVVSRFFNISVEDLLSKKRNKELVFPRHVSMYLCRSLTDMSYPEIGNAFNGRHHTTVITACEQMEKQVETSSELKATLAELKKNIIK